MPPVPTIAARYFFIITLLLVLLLLMEVWGTPVRRPPQKGGTGPIVVNSTLGGANKGRISLPLDEAGPMVSN